MSVPTVGGVTITQEGSRRPACRASWASLCGVLLLAAPSLLGCRQGPRSDIESVRSIAPVGQYGGSVGAIGVSGDRAWIATGSRVVAVDVSDPAQPVALGQSEVLPGLPHAISADGDTLVAALGTNGAAVFDVSGDDILWIRHWIATSWAVNDVALRDGLVYMAEGKKGLRVLRLAGSSAPQPVGVVDTPGDSLAVALDGDIAYVADWGTGVRIVDIADPASPREVAWIDTPGEAVDVAAWQGLLLVADRHGGLRVIDVSSPEQPREVQVIDIGGYAERVSTDGQLAYVAAHDAGLVTVDLNGPTSGPAIERLEGVAVAVDTVVEGGQVYVSDAGASVAPTTNDLQDSWGQVHMWGVEARPEMAQSLAGLYIAVRSVSGELATVGQLHSPSMIESVVVDEDVGLAYLAGGYAGLLVVSLEDPQRPSLVAKIDTSGASHDSLIHGSQLLVADGDAGLVVFDISRPESPALVGSVDTPGEALGIAVAGDLAYVADGEEGLRVVDLASMQEIAAHDTPGYAIDVVVVPGHAYVCDRQGGLRVFNLQKPAAPVELTSLFEGTGDVVDFAPADETTEIAWVAAGPSGLRAINISDPSAPRQIASLPFEDSAVGLLLDGDVAYVAAGGAGLRVVDISDPHAPREIAGGDLPGLAERLARFDDWIYVAAEMGGLQVFERLDSLESERGPPNGYRFPQNRSAGQSMSRATSP